MPDTGIRLSQMEGVTQVRLDRPPVNALDLPTINAVQSAFETADSSAPIILTGTGKAFSAGVDTRAFGAYSGQEKADMIRAITRMVSAIVSHPAPVIAAVNGHALGGGFVLMLCADFRVVTDDTDAKFGLTEARAGVPFPAGPLEVIRHEVSPGLLRRLTLSSEIVRASTLMSEGLADQLASPDQLQPSAIKAAQDLASQPAFAVVKRQIRGDLQKQLKALAASGKDPLADQFSTSG